MLTPTVDGKKLAFTMRKPFDVVLELAECPNGLPVPEVIITIISDREYMENLFRSYCFLREMERQKEGR